MTQLEKIQAVSVMRVLAMLMIVSFHSLCFYTHRWWSLGGIYIPIWDKMATLLDAIDLPMFVFISGFLFGHLYIKGKYRKWQSFIQSKVYRLLVPYLFWGVFLIIIMPSLHEWSYMLTGISHLWFLLMLFEIFIIIIPFAHFLCLKATKLQVAIITLGSYILFLLIMNLPITIVSFVSTIPYPIYQCSSLEFSAHASKYTAIYQINLPLSHWLFLYHY